jgi:hypothetical protein
MVTGMLCRICLKEFIRNTNTVCCSDECRLENKRQSKRRSYHKIGKFTDDRYHRTILQKMRRIAERIRKKYES